MSITMNWITSFFSILLLCCGAFNSFAQNNFIEGELTYQVRIESTDAEAAKINSTGTFTLLLKGNSVAKTLVLNNGYKNIFIYNNSKKATYSLRNIGDKKLALLLEPDIIAKKQQRCNSLKIEELPADNRTVLNFRTERAKLLCNNAMPVTVYYTKDWHINSPYLFDEFPSFQHLPLLFDIKNEDGSTLHFELKGIEAKPMDNSTFEVPNEYKIITSEEYNSWQH